METVRSLRARVAICLALALGLMLTGGVAVPASEAAAAGQVSESTVSKAPRPAASQKPMTMAERRRQIAKDAERGREIKVPPRSKKEAARKGDRLNGAAPVVDYRAQMARWELYGPDGSLVGLEHRYPRPESELDGFVMEDGGKYTLKTEVWYDKESEISVIDEDDGPQPVSLRLALNCLDAFVQSETKVVNAPAQRYSPRYPELGGKAGTGAPVTFEFIYDNELCERGVREYAEEHPTLPQVAPYFGVMTVAPDPTGDWPDFMDIPSIQAFGYSNIPVEQTFGAHCDSNSASAAHCQSSYGGVNTATGAFNLYRNDAASHGSNPISLNRNYSSKNPKAGSLGVGWAVPWDASLNFATNGDATFNAEDGSQYKYKKSSTGEYSSSGAFYSTLKASGAGHVLDSLDGRKLTFDSTGRLTKSQNRQQLAHSYSYGESGKILSITGSFGDRVEFEYNEDNRISDARFGDGRRVGYAYTSGRLSSVTGPDREAIRYEYSTQGNLAVVKDQRGNLAVTNTYDSSDRVSKQVDPMDAETSFTYRKGETEVKAPDGGIWSDIYSGNILTDQYDPLGNKTSYTYSHKLDLIATTDPLGRTQETAVDRNGRLKERRGPLTLERWTYLSDGTLRSYSDGNFNTSQYLYDGKDRLTSATDPLLGGSAYTYTPSGLMETVRSPGGNKTIYGYDSSGNQTSVTSPGGEQLTRKFDSAGRPVTVTDPRGSESGADPARFTHTYKYDDAGRVTEEKDARGNITSNEYDAAGNLVSVKDGVEGTVLYEYDAANRLKKTTDQAGNTSTLTYDPVGRIESRTDTTGAKTTYTYDKAGRLVALTNPQGNVAGADAADYTWKYGYDEVGNQTTVTDPASKTTRTDYDEENRPVKVTDPLGRDKQTSYDDANNVRTTTDALGKVTTYTYDKNNRLTLVEDRGGDKVTYEYDSDGNKTSETSPLGNKTTYAYDANGRLTQRVDPRGTVTGADPAEYTWRIGYDAAGNPTSEMNPLGHKSEKIYDGVGNVTEQTDSRGKKTGFEYDGLNRPRKITGPDGGTTVTYDELGNTKSRTDANQRVTSYSYDEAGRLTKVTDPLDRSTAYAYDPDGNRTQVTNARGQTHISSYDGRGLLTKTVYSDGTPTVSYAYYDSGQPRTVTDGTGTRTLTYDAEDRPLTITSPGAANPFTYAYNNNGTVKSRTYPDGRATTYDYDADGRMTGQTVGGKTTVYGWDAAGNLTSTKLPTTTARTETRTYDRAGMLASVTDRTGARHFERDAAGRVVTDRFKDAASTGLADRYAYDDAGRMVRACADVTTSASCLEGSTGSTYSYDPVGNLIQAATTARTTTNTYDAADQLTKSVTGTTTTDFAYDADGNQTKDAKGTYLYDAASRVKSATVGANTFTFGYDADGNRTTSRTNGALVRTSRWDVNNPLPQIATDTNSTGGLLADYHYSPLGGAAGLSRTEGSFYFQHDRQNSVATVYDAKGTENYRYTYSPWGESTGKASIEGGQTSIFGYGGQYKDQYLVGKLHLRARTYDPTTQRFTTTDPVPSQAGSPNSSPYAYANNDPVNQSDPSGRCPLCISAGIGAAFGAVIDGGLYSWQNRNNGEFSWGGLAGAAGKGAATGAAAGLLMPGVGNAAARGLGLSGARGIATSSAVNAGVGAGFSWAVNEANCRPTGPWDLLFGAAGGSASSLIGPAFGWLKNRTFAPRVTVSAHSEPRTFPNRYADDPNILSRELAHAAAAGVAPIGAGTQAFERAVSSGGKYLWAVGADGQLRIIPHASSKIKHSVLFRGGRVQGAGDVTFSGGRVSQISDQSGHYFPDQSRNYFAWLDDNTGSFLKSGVDAFRNAGLHVPEEAIEKFGW
ncbi:RHS repeat-associated core domain-containing protein [Streptomyces sp. NPDC051217]|uniref:RHS repeat-associated core domain-containing protein n=1 Tax=Streptomyces sp. NPDC051217 TaxID=3365644 RepID=UPI0037968633